MIAGEEADAEALEAVENLLESYFVQIDSTFDKLEAIGASSNQANVILCSARSCVEWIALALSLV